MKRLGCSCINTQPSGGTGSLRLPLIKRQQFTQTLLTHFSLIKKNRTKLNKPDLTLIIVSECSLVRHLIAKNDSPATAGPSIFAPCNFVAHTKPSGSTGSLRLPMIIKAAIHADTFNAFCSIKKIRTKLNKPDLTLIIVSGCSLFRHIIAKNDSPATAGPSIFAPCNFVAHTKPSGGTGSLRLPLIKRQQFTQTLLIRYIDLY